MNTMEKIVEEIHTLPETDAREVLDFVGYLKAKRAQAKAEAADMSEFDQFGAVFDGKFNSWAERNAEALLEHGRSIAATGLAGEEFDRI